MPTCNNAGVLRTFNNQLTGAIRSSLLTDSLVYSQAVNAGKRVFRSSSELTAYRRAQSLAGSKNGPGPAQSVIITNLQAFGC